MIADIPPPFDSGWFLFTFGFIVGAVLGSFGTMLAHRIPRKISLLFPRSSCPSCRTILGVFDLLPIGSWLIMKGRCRYCKTPIGMRYLFIELATAFGCAAATVFIGFSPWLILAYTLVLSLVVSICIKRDS